MSDDEFDELITAGSERGALLAARVGRHPLTRALYLLAAAIAATTVTLALVGHAQSGTTRRTRSVVAPRPTVAPVSHTSSPEVDNEYLYAVPAQDLRAALGRCRTKCVASTLTGAALSRRAAAFRGIQPLAGGTVSAATGRVIFESIEALATPDALAHLVARRVGGRALTGPTIDEKADGGSQTVTVRQRRGGWELTAHLVVRGTRPPTEAAVIWASTTPLPG